MKIINYIGWGLLVAPFAWFIYVTWPYGIEALGVGVSVFIWIMGSFYLITKGRIE